MDPTHVPVLVAAIGGMCLVITGLITFLGTRSQTALIERLQVDFQTERTERIRLETRVKRLEIENGQLDDDGDELRDRLRIVEHIAIHSTDPPPRQLPPWLWDIRRRAEQS